MHRYVFSDVGLTAPKPAAKSPVTTKTGKDKRTSQSLLLFSLLRADEKIELICSLVYMFILSIKWLHYIIRRMRKSEIQGKYVYPCLNQRAIL